jgi:hypothetical protein
LISCDSQKSDVLVIDPLKFSNDKFTLSMIADDVSYISLDNQVPLGLVYSFIYNKNGLFISTKELGLLHFDNNGKFIKVLAKKGRGPNEYRYGLHLTMDEENKNIYIVDGSTIKVYQLDGRFIRSFSIKDFLFARDIEFFHSSLFLADYGEAGTFKYNWVITDTLGNKLSYKYSSVNNPGFLIRGSTYKIGDKLFYYNWLNDTIFSIYPDFSFKPGYLFAQGNFRWHENLDFNIAHKKMKSLFRPMSMFETNHFIFLRYAFRDKEPSILMIDKKTKETYRGYVQNYGACIENDFDGGLHFLTKSYHFCYYTDIHEYIITLINPFELKAHNDSEAFRNSTPKYPEKKKELEKLGNSLDENDNPVLMLVKLKE